MAKTERKNKGRTTKIFNIKLVDNIDKAQFHFHVYYSYDPLADWIPLGLVTLDQNMENCEIELLGEVPKDIIVKLIQEVQFYLHDKPEEDHIGYMFYHIRSLSNIYSHIHWDYIRTQSNM